MREKFIAGSGIEYSVFYLLKYNPSAVNAAIATGKPPPDDGYENAFEVLHEVNERFEHY